MVTIIGNGIGDYDFKNISLNLKDYDAILCDKNFKEDGKNVLKLGFSEIKEYILQNYAKQNILYVVTGSPLFYSGALTIAKLLPNECVDFINNTSCLDYMLAKLKISINDVGVCSLHGKTELDLNAFFAKKYSFIVCDKDSIGILQKKLQYVVKQNYTTTVGYKLGYSDEQISEIDLYGINFDLHEPYVLLFEKKFVDLPCVDENFITERGMITKQFKRDFSLANLDLQPNELLWDIGAGSGSCAITAHKKYRVKTTLFEKNEVRAENIAQNLKNHSVVDCELFVGNASDYFENIAQNPNKIFVGGGGEEIMSSLDYLYNRLCKNGIMLLNIVTLKHLNIAINSLKSANITYEIFSFSLTTYKTDLDLAEPERQMFQIKVAKQA